MAASVAAGGLDSMDGMDGMRNLDGILKGGAGGEDDLLLPTFEDLTPFEVEHFVQELKEFQLEEVGNHWWLTQHERLEKLNFTAHNQAKEGLDEYVIDQFNTLEKVPTLIYDLVLIEVWKEKIWPLVKADIAKFSSLRTYIPVYHEASVSNLLEICLFHRTSCEEAGDALIDLVDWCVRKLRHVLHTPNEELVRQIGSAKECTEWDTVRCLDEQFMECEFQVCMHVISILRFLTDHRVAIPLAVTTRLLDTHDILLLLVPLMEKAPWVRKNRINGRIEKFEENKWERVEASDEGRLPKLHTQVWLSIYNLVMDAECRGRYMLTSFRRENLLRLRRYINEVVVDQLPPLTNLHRTLEELSISGQFTGAADAPAPSPFVVELVAEARETLVRSYEGRWQEVADLQLKTVLVKETPEEMNRLGQMISVPKELFDEEPPPSSDTVAGEGTGTATGDGRTAANSSAATAAWEAVLSLPLVRSTASFFAAVRAEEAPLDQVILLSASPQDTPSAGGRLRLEMRRTRHGQLGGSAGQRAVADSTLLSIRAEKPEEVFLLAVDAPGVNLATSLRSMHYVTQKGAEKSAGKLRELLHKPGREALLAMYREDVPEFAVSVLASGQSGADGIDCALVPDLSVPVPAEA